MSHIITKTRVKGGIFVLFLFVIIPFNTLARKAKVIEVEGYSLVESEKNLSQEEMEQKAIFEAKKDAMIKAFGQKVASSDAMIINDDNTHVSSHITSEVKGEWISTASAKVNTFVESGKIMYECNIKGLARENSAEKIDFEVAIIKNSPDLKYATTDGIFNNGDDLFVYFMSPVSGYLNIYLLDDESAYCLLPYKNSEEGSFYVKADKEYIFFSTNTASDNKVEVDEYELKTEHPIEINTLDFYFSPEKFTKSKLKANENDATMVKNTDLNTFNKWRTRLLSNNDEITYRTVTLQIHNKEEH